MSNDFSGTPTPLVAPVAFSVVGGGTFQGQPGNTTLMYLLSYMQTCANAYACAAWPAGGPVVENVYGFDPDDAGFSQAWLPAMFLWADSIGESYRIAEDYLVREVTLKLLWLPKSPPGQDKQRSRGPFGTGLHGILAIAFDQERQPAWVVQGDPDATAAEYGSMIGNFVHFFRLHFTGWKPTTYLNKMADGSPLPFRGFEGTIKMLETWDRDLGTFDLLSGGLVTTLQSADATPLFLGRALNT